MGNGTWIFIPLFISLFLVGYWMYRKAKTEWLEFHKSLLKKESELFELYNLVEGILCEIQELYLSKITADDERTIKKGQFINAYADSNVLEIKDYSNDDGNAQDNKGDLSLMNRADQSARIIKMKNEGYSEAEIARMLAIGEGEVKLMINLKSNS